MFDEERDVFIVKRILIDKHFTLIGGAIPGAFYLAPGYFYISAVFYWLSGLNPIGPAIAASTLGVISTFLVFFVSLKFFDKKTAVFASLFYCVSYLIVGYNRTWWPLTFGPVISLVTYYSLYRIIKNRRFIWSFPLTIALIIGAHSDPSNFSLIILTVILLIIYKVPPNRYIKLSIFLFLFSHLPLVIFDLRHNFFNSKLIFKMLTFGSNSTGLDLNNLLSSLMLFPQTLSRLIYVKDPDWSLQIVPFKFYLDKKFNEIPIFIFIISTLILFWFAAKTIKALFSKDDLPTKIIGIHFLIALAGVVLYNIFFPNYTYEWFLQVLFANFTIIIGLLISRLIKFQPLTLLIWIVFGIYLFVSIWTFNGAKNPYGFGSKSQAVKWAISQVGSKDFSLDAPSSSFSYGGYRYLFYLFGHEPVKSYMDPVFVDWIYPASKISTDHPDTVVVIMNPDLFFDQTYWDSYQAYLTKTISRKKFSEKIEVLIVDNSDKWVDW